MFTTNFYETDISLRNSSEDLIWFIQAWIYLIWVTEAVRGQKPSSVGQKSMKEWIFWKKFFNDLKNPLACLIRFKLWHQMSKIWGPWHQHTLRATVGLTKSQGLFQWSLCSLCINQSIKTVAAKSHHNCYSQKNKRQAHNFFYKPQFDGPFFLDLRILYKWWTWSHFVLVEETMDLSCILLAVW